MTNGIEQRIERVDPLSGYRLLVTWVGGVRTPVDFSADVGRGGIWTLLRDEAKFRAARVSHDGRVLEWPEPAGQDGEPRIDVDADGLWWKAANQMAEPVLQRAAGQDFFHPRKT